MITPVRSFSAIKGSLLGLFFFVLVFGTISVWGQTNPAAQSLPYSQDFSGLTHAGTTYPAGWQGWQLSTGGPATTFRVTAPTANLSLIANSTAATNSGGVHNFNGKIGFLQSGGNDPAIVLAINTTGLSSVKVSYDIMTIRNPYDGSTNTRINEATLQYRVGTTGNFTTLTGIEYQNNTTAQTAAVTTPQNLQSKTITLPSACDNNAVVQLRWVARDVTGAGARPSFAVDNITICTPPPCSITGPDFVCNNTSDITYSGPANMNSYSWSISGAGGSIPGSTTGSSVAVTTGNFLTDFTLFLTVTDDNGCSSTCQKQVFNFLLKPPADITISPGTTVCLGATLDLSIASASSSTVAWTGEGVSDPDGAFIPNPFAFYGFDNVTTAIPTTTGPHIYGVTVTTDYGCSNTGTVSVTVNPLPPAPTCPQNSSVCLSAPAFALTGGSPGGGVYSGAGVSAGNFNPAAAGAGMHTITYTVTDGNGCSNSCTFTITVNSPPNVTCPSYSSVCSTASPFALSGGSPGGGTYSGPGVSAGTFNPAAAGTGMHTIQYTVTDGNGCTGACTFTITVETCSSNIDFSGKIIFSNNNALGVNNATVTLAGSANGSDVTDVNGEFYINTALSSGSFTLTPAKTTDKLNGVTAADATAIQQHAANSVLITDLYKQVAADVNKSNSINTLDASLVTQSLLGNPAALAQFKTSWRFVPTSHIMTNPPWNFPEKRTYANINSPQSGQDFYGIKTGDVVSAFANPANFGASQPLVLQDKDRQLQAGETFMVEFSASQMDGLAAFQCALRFDPEQLQFVEVQPLAGLPLTMDNFGTFNIAEGEIRLVWAQATEIAVAESTPVFRLQFTALQSGSKLSEVLQLDESELPALAYNGALAESKIELVFTELTGTGNLASAAGVQLLQNRPNPFTGTTAIAFVLPESCEAQLRIFDVSGRMLAEKKAQYPAGRNEEIFNLQGVSGVLWYELTTPLGVLTKKMVAVR